MLHEMTLFPKPYASIASGQKTIELRLYDEKRQSIHIGDQIRFTNTEDTSQTTLCEVVQLHIFKDFRELYENLPLLQCGYTLEDVGDAHPDDMLTYYSKEKQTQYESIDLGERAGEEFVYVPLNKKKRKDFLDTVAITDVKSILYGYPNQPIRLANGYSGYVQIFEVFVT